MNLFSPPPRLDRLQIEITTACNLRCAGCQRTEGVVAGSWESRHMPVDRFVRVMEHAPPARALVLQGIGEPSLHPHLAQLCRLGADSGKFAMIGFNTNALARDPSYFADLRQHGLTHLSVSVDSLVPALATQARAGTDCGRLRSAIATLAAVFAHRLTLSVVVSRANLEGLAGLLEELARLGGRLVEIQPLVSYGPAGQGLHLDAMGLERLRRIIARQRRLFPAQTIIPAPAVIPNGGRCRRPFHAAYVTVEGMLTPCCLTDDAGLFGQADLGRQDFATLWQSDTVAEWFTAYLDRLPEICRGCSNDPSGGRVATVADAADALRQGLAQARTGDAPQAEQSFRRALDSPSSVEALHQLAIQAQQRGQTGQAVALLQTAQTLRPSPRQAHNLAVLLNSLGDRQGADRLLVSAIRGDRDDTQAYRTLAAQRRQAGDKPGSAQILHLLLNRQMETGTATGTEVLVDELLSVDTDGKLLETANLLRSVGWTGLAGRILGMLAQRHPGHLGIALYRCIALLPVCYQSDGEIEAVRQRYRAALTNFADAVVAASPDQLQTGAAQVGGAKPFYLSYQGRNDHDLQSLYGRSISRLLAAADGPLPAPAIRTDRKRRIGIVSAYFRFHSISKLFAGWIRRLDPESFDLIAYDLRGEPPTPWVSGQLDLCRGGVRRGPAEDAAWIKAILGDAPDVLIYPEIGMEPMAVRLAARRLAPVQCVSWGHPVTTGLPSIDYFLSGALMEPEDGQSHYTERLVRLPNLGIWYEPLPDGGQRLNRAGLGLRDDAVVFVCCQSLYKYQPRYDGVLIRIAQALPQAQFLFIGAAEAPRTAQFRQRLTAAFAAAGLDVARHVVVTQPVPPEAFPGLLRLGDVYLDSMDWSGGNTSLEAAACDLPLLTLPGPLMRGRHTAGILRMMGLPQFIATDEDDYVAQAVALASPHRRREASHLVAERKQRLYRDETAIKALEDFLRKAITRP